MTNENNSNLNNSKSENDNQTTAEQNTEPTQEAKSAESSQKPVTETINFGRWLKEQRLAKKISLEEIAAVTKVHISQLRALEEDNKKQLPAPAFVRGFLVSYARHLGIEEDDVLQRYMSSLSDDVQSKIIIPKVNKAAISSTHPKVRVVTAPTFKKAPASNDVNEKEVPVINFKKAGMIFGMVMLVVVAASLIAIGKKQANKRREEALAQSQLQAQPQPAPAPAPEAAPSSPSATTAPTTAPATPAAAPSTSAATATTQPQASEPKPQYTLEVRATEDTWVNIRTDENRSTGLSLKLGSTHAVQAHRKIQLSLSNAGAIELKWNGVAYEAPGFRGDVKTLVLPEQLDSLKKKADKPAVAKPKAPVAPKPAAPAAAAAPAPAAPAPAAPATPNP